MRFHAANELIRIEQWLPRVEEIRGSLSPEA